jgi:hypothetical protein
MDRYLQMLLKICRSSAAQTHAVFEETQGNIAVAAQEPSHLTCRVTVVHTKTLSGAARVFAYCAHSVLPFKHLLVLINVNAKMVLECVVFHTALASRCVVISSLYNVQLFSRNVIGLGPTSARFARREKTIRMASAPIKFFGRFQRVTVFADLFNSEGERGLVYSFESQGVNLHDRFAFG